MILSWEVPSPSPDADGYIIYYYQVNCGSIISEKIVGGDVGEYTLVDLTPGTWYNISIRAYQDILGPSSEEISVMTNAKPASKCFCVHTFKTITGTHIHLYHFQHHIQVY